MGRGQGRRNQDRLRVAGDIDTHRAIGCIAPGGAAVQTYLLLAKQFIGDVGFPIFVATLLLYRVESWHTQNITALAALKEAVLDRHLAVHCRAAARRQRHRRRPRPRRPK